MPTAGEEALKKGVLGIVGFGLMLAALAGCAIPGAAISAQQYPVPREEAEWIVKGAPIEFEGHRWFPQDYVDILLDTEVTPAGEYQGVQFFVEKIDVRPYDRLYTKFGFNKFRVFTQIQDHDKSKKSF